jgi:hypothetical protein
MSKIDIAFGIIIAAVWILPLLSLSRILPFFRRNNAVIEGKINLAEAGEVPYLWRVSRKKPDSPTDVLREERFANEVYLNDGTKSIALKTLEVDDEQLIRSAHNYSFSISKEESENLLRTQAENIKCRLDLEKLISKGSGSGGRWLSILTLSPDSQATLVGKRLALAPQKKYLKEMCMNVLIASLISSAGTYGLLKLKSYVIQREKMGLGPA